MPLSTFLRDNPLTRIRGLQFLSFDETAVIQRRTAMTDSNDPAWPGGTAPYNSGGGAYFTWGNVGTAPCRIYPVTIRGKGALIGGQINERATHFCSLPPQTQITTSDRILLANRGTFEVVMALETTDAFTTRVEVFQIS